MTKKSLLAYSVITILMFAIVWFAVDMSIWSTGNASNNVILLDGPLILKPKAVSADEIKIKDESPIVGIFNNGVARAYVLSSFFEKTQHVVNDVVGEKAYTLTYCDLNDCVKVYTNSSSGGEPLDVTVGGWIGTNLHGALLLRVGSTLYNQSTGQAITSDKQFPYEAASFERMTWKEWKAKYPKTEVYYQNNKKQASPVPNL